MLVAAVPTHLNLETSGGAGMSLMKHVPNIQTEINNKYSNGIRMGGFAEIPITSGGTCKAVYLTSIAPWNVEKSKKDEDMVNLTSVFCPIDKKNLNHIFIIFSEII